MLYVEEFVVQYIREVRILDPGIGGKKLWEMYRRDFQEKNLSEETIFIKPNDQSRTCSSFGKAKKTRDDNPTCML